MSRDHFSYRGERRDAARRKLRGDRRDRFTEAFRAAMKDPNHEGPVYASGPRPDWRTVWRNSPPYRAKKIGSR